MNAPAQRQVFGPPTLYKLPSFSDEKLQPSSFHYISLLSWLILFILNIAVRI